jgi:hypothetical protein
MKKLSSKISEKPITSIIFTTLITIFLTASVIYSTNLRNVFTADGIYAVKDMQSIVLKGDAELPLYEEAVSNMRNFPSDRVLIIQSGFGKFIPGTRFNDLIYYKGVYSGDFYETSVSLAKIERGVICLDSLSVSAFTDVPPCRLSIKQRTKLAADASKLVNHMANQN